MTIKQLAEYASARYDQPGRKWERLTGPIAHGEERREGCSFAQMLAEAVAHRAAIDMNDKKRMNTKWKRSQLSL